MRALISVSDKTGVVELARELAALGVACSRPAAPRSCSPTPASRSPRSPRTPAFPRCSTAASRRCTRRSTAACSRAATMPAHMAALAAARHRDRSTCSSSTSIRSRRRSPRAGCTLDEAIENIDIGGPAMVRSAAKNWNDVAVLTDASQYAGVARRAEARRRGLEGDALRARGRRVRPHRRSTTARSATTCRRSPARADGVPERHEFPAQANGRFVKLQDLRYGENPHQRAAFYRDLAPAPGSLVTARAAAGQGALVQQHRRRRRGVGMRQVLRRAGVRHRQAREPVRRRGRRRRRRRRTRRRSRPIRRRRSAASSPSTARSTRAAPSASPSSSSRC